MAGMCGIIMIKTCRSHGTLIIKNLLTVTKGLRYISDSDPFAERPIMRSISFSSFHGIWRWFQQRSKHLHRNDDQRQMEIRGSQCWCAAGAWYLVTGYAALLSRWSFDQSSVLVLAIRDPRRYHQPDCSNDADDEYFASVYMICGVWYFNRYCRRKAPRDIKCVLIP